MKYVLFPRETRCFPVGSAKCILRIADGRDEALICNKLFRLFSISCFVETHKSVNIVARLWGRSHEGLARGGGGDGGLSNSLSNLTGEDNTSSLPTCFPAGT